jgi:secondary thiamine-phosphate synthase enzyme
MIIKEITITSRKREELIEITQDIKNIIRKEGIRQGFCLVYIPHTTAGVLINENADPSVADDISEYLKKLIPKDNPEYTHLEGNADSHIKASIIGQSKTLLIKDNELVLGTWQGVFFCEFDGPRKRKAIVSIL